ncbi:hypothetical protein [Amycolatopsis sp. NPDC059657]|uniref:hypothetical protein n=1 Tax=Amycolatopsis sp. NPDC059657 TaxID=3346899 RepID=UPI00366CDA6A
MRKTMSAMAVCLALIVSFSIPGQAFAHSYSAQDKAAADRALVNWIAMKDSRSVVRAVAWSALLSEDQPGAVERFLTSEYDFAKGLAAQSAQQNLDFVERVLATYLAEFAPTVHAAARRALNGTDGDREFFVATGFAAAEAQDRTVRDTAGEHARALVQADRDYVRGLAQSDPGATVRNAASWAVRPGATDTDMVEFFAYGWTSGAKVDIDVYHAQASDSDVAWRRSVSRLAGEARAAEQAAREASAEFAEAARAEAAAAWREVGARTAPARSAWAEAQEISARQADNWQAVAEKAAAAAGPNWQAITGPAQVTRQDWMTEQEFAAEQTRQWNELLAQARAGEQRMSR